jgi:hypothetical protein
MWIHHCDPETEQESMQWKHHDSYITKSFTHSHQLKRPWQWCLEICREIHLCTKCHTRQ